MKLAVSVKGSDPFPSSQFQCFFSFPQEGQTPFLPQPNRAGMKQRLLPYLQLLRLPAVFTAMADICLGFLLTHDSFEPRLKFGLLLVASSCLYLTGMVFNDIFDRNIDAKERPNRPIPSGRVPFMSALKMGILLLLAGLGAAKVAGIQSLIVAAVLTGCIFAYNGYLKKTFAGPIAMGACRFLNVMLGASAVEPATTLWQLPQLHVAAGLGIYIIGVTWFARQEAIISNRNQLLLGIGVINLGLAILIGFLLNWHGHERAMVLFVLAVIALTINRRVIAAMFDPVPHQVQTAVKTLLLSLVMLDATMILFVTGNVAYAAATAALLIPSIVIARWIAVT